MLLQIQEIQLTIFIGSMIIIFFTVIIIVTIAQYKQRVYKHELEKEQLEARFSKTLLQSQLEIKEQTLQHVSHELHDNLGQVASLIKIHLHTLQPGNNTATKEKINAIKDLVRQLISDLKFMSVSLNSDRVAQLGIRKSIEDEVVRLNKTGRLKAFFLEESSSTNTLDGNKATILYRMVQEIINNAVKHSKAKRIDISMKMSENVFTLVCSDNGVGFKVEEQLGSGSGLRNLQHRARMINGQVTFNSAPRQGTTITIEIPI